VRRHALARPDQAGAEPRHLNAIAGWREAPASFFSERERAALNWAEAVNALPHKHPGDADFDLLKAISATTKSPK
jgi:alkylhydroperoxidase family enzyme